MHIPHCTPRCRLATKERALFGAEVDRRGARHPCRLQSLKPQTRHPAAPSCVASALPPHRRSPHGRRRPHPAAKPRPRAPPRTTPRPRPSAATRRPRPSSPSLLHGATEGVPTFCSVKKLRMPVLCRLTMQRPGGRDLCVLRETRVETLVRRGVSEAMGVGACVSGMQQATTTHQSGAFLIGAARQDP